MARSSRIRSGILIGTLALAAPCALVACEAITGLSKYEKTQCDGLRCSDEDASDAEISLGEGGPDSAPGAEPVQWARWQMPNYVPSESQKPPGIEAGVENTVSYTTAAGEGVRDEVTKLVWAMPMPDVGAKNYKDAVKVCSELKGGPWRLPSRIELVSLLDYSKSGVTAAAVFTTGAGRIIGTRYWTSSEVRPFGKDGRLQYWGVDFGGSGVAKLDADQLYAVRCVKGAS